jgi:hypothetical protein
LEKLLPTVETATEVNEEDHNVFIPFVNVQSVGGKFDDASFSAGYEIGLLDFRLFQASVIFSVSLLITIQKDNESQADLMAMKHGYVISHKALDDSGTQLNCVFTKSRDLES